jgi:undecaprenyl-diphosphatase
VATLHRRGRLTPRLLLAVAGFAVAAVPVTLLAYAATHGWGPLHEVDAGAASSTHDWVARRPGMVSFLDAVAVVMHPWVLRAVLAVVVCVLLVRRQRRLALWAAVTTVVAGLLGDGLKTVVARARPVLPDPVSTAPGFSFPSGHALNSFVVLAILLLLVLPLVPRRWRWVPWAVAVGGTLLVGFDRVALGVHYVSDVVGGWLLGAGLLAVTVAAFESWRASGGRRKPHVLAEGVDPAASQAAVRTGTPPR